MSDVFQDAVAHVLLADYAGIDGGGKLNVIGGGISLMGITPTGATPPFCVVAQISLPEKHVGKQLSWTLELRDEATNDLVSLPGAPGNGMRIDQVIVVGPIQIPSDVQRPSHLRATAQVLFGVPGGMPLVPGRSYKWKLRVDGQSRVSWEAPFSVLASLPAPTVGGPTGPATIEGVEDLSADVPEDSD